MDERRARPDAVLELVEGSAHRLARRSRGEPHRSACAGAPAQPGVAPPRLAPRREARGFRFRRRALLASAADAGAARRPGDHDSRSELPDASRAHPGRDSPRLSCPRAQSRAPRGSDHRPLSVHRNRSGAAAWSAGGAHRDLSAGRAGLGAEGGRAETRIRVVLRHARTAQERRRFARRLRTAARRASEADASRSWSSPGAPPRTRSRGSSGSSARR